MVNKAPSIAKEHRIGVNIHRKVTANLPKTFKNEVAVTSNKEGSGSVNIQQTRSLNKSGIKRNITTFHQKLPQERHLRGKIKKANNEKKNIQCNTFQFRRKRSDRILDGKNSYIRKKGEDIQILMALQTAGKLGKSKSSKSQTTWFTLSRQ
jgi:hypothetical protein